MDIKTKNNEVHIPAWAIIFGGLVLDNIVTNVLRLKAYKKALETEKEE